MARPDRGHNSRSKQRFFRHMSESHIYAATRLLSLGEHKFSVLRSAVHSKPQRTLDGLSLRVPFSASSASFRNKQQRSLNVPTDRSHCVYPSRWFVSSILLEVDCEDWCVCVQATTCVREFWLYTDAWTVWFSQRSSNVGPKWTSRLQATSS